jgi:aspartate/methionine/tyrosine aminotransferase
MRFARAMDHLGMESAFAVLAEAKRLEREGRDVVHLEIGEPDFDTPAHIVEAAIKALRDGYTHYTPSGGLAEAREAYARFVTKTRGVPVDPSELVITPGAKPVVFLSLLAILDPGDEVICPNPSYPTYESVTGFVGARPVPVRLREENDFRFDLNEFADRISSKTKLIILNSPANPTGGVLTKEDMREIGRLAIKHDLWVLTDEIYWQILYEGEFASIFPIEGMKERTVLLDGHSKAYAMTGWRLGFAVAPKALADHLVKLMNNSNSCTAAFTQIAGIAALEGSKGPTQEMVSEFKRRRDVIVDELNRIPHVTCSMPKGAFYAFPNISHYCKGDRNALWIQDYLLAEAGVASLAGTAFGEYGEGYLRFSYANSVDNIRKAMQRTAEALQALG